MTRGRKGEKTCIGDPGWYIPLAGLSCTCWGLVAPLKGKEGCGGEDVV